MRTSPTAVDPAERDALTKGAGRISAAYVVGAGLPSMGRRPFRPTVEPVRFGLPGLDESGYSGDKLSTGEPPDTDPYVRWWERWGRATFPGHSIRYDT